MSERPAVRKMKFFYIQTALLMVIAVLGHVTDDSHMYFVHGSSCYVKRSALPSVTVLRHGVQLATVSSSSVRPFSQAR